MKDATVAIEDQRFYQHKGVDFEGVIRAAIKNFESKGEKVQGGSTLTMQLIKNLYSQDRERDYKRKIREAKLAEELENLHPGTTGKNWILTTYLNSVPYGTVGGQNAYGIEAASRIYFDKHAKDLTLPEAATAGRPAAGALAVQPVPGPRRRAAPSQRGPAQDARPRLHRHVAVLRRPRVEDRAPQVRLLPVAARELLLRLRPPGARAQVRQAQGRARAGCGSTRRSNFDMQKKARKAIAGRLAAPGSPSSALVSIDPKNGHIRAMASSANYGDSKFNLATQAKRQPGSTFKIIVLMTALARGVDINKTTYQSKKLDFVDPTYGKIEVSNSDGGASGGSKTLFNAVVSSDNTVFQQLDLDLGPPAVTKMARAMGVTSHMDSYPAEALGGFKYGVSVLEMARAFVTVNDGGYRIRPVAITKVVDPDGSVDTSLSKPEKKKAFTDGQAYEAIQAMKANAARGTGVAANLGFCPTAGKTGTTSGFIDAWFNGMTSNLNTTVWVGYPKQNTPMTNVPGYGTMFGGDAPAQIWHDFMASAVDRKGCTDWPQPKEPFVAEPFFGKYASRSVSTGPDGKDGGSKDGTNPDATNPDDGQTQGPGGTQYPPEQYATPPQVAAGHPGPAAAPAGYVGRRRDHPDALTMPQPPRAGHPLP